MENSKYLKYKNKYFKMKGGVWNDSIKNYLKIGVNMAFENNLIESLVVNLKEYNNFATELYNHYLDLYKKIRILAKENDISLEEITELNQDNITIITVFDYIWNIGRKIVSYYVIFKLLDINTISLIELTNVFEYYEQNKDRGNDIINIIEQHYTNSKSFFETELIKLKEVVKQNTDKLTKEYIIKNINDLVNRIIFVVIDVHSNFLTKNKYIDLKSKTPNYNLQSITKVNSVSNSDFLKSFNIESDTIERIKKIYKNDQIDYEQKDIGMTNVIVSKSSLFYETYNKCGYKIVAGPSGSIYAYIGYLILISKQIEISNDLLNNFIFCALVYMILRSDHSLMECLISLPPCDFDISNRTEKDYIASLKNLDCNLLFVKFENLIGKITLEKTYIEELIKSRNSVNAIIK